MRLIFKVQMFKKNFLKNVFVWTLDMDMGPLTAGPSEALTAESGLERNKVPSWCRVPAQSSSGGRKRGMVCSLKPHDGA